MKFILLILIIVLGVNAQSDDVDDEIFSELSRVFKEFLAKHEMEMNCVQEKLSNPTLQAKLMVNSGNFHFSNKLFGFLL